MGKSLQGSTPANGSTKADRAGTLQPMVIGHSVERPPPLTSRIRQAGQTCSWWPNTAVLQKTKANRSRPVLFQSSGSHYLFQGIPETGSQLP